MFTRFDTNKSTKGASKLRRDLINAEIANLRDLLPLPPSTRQRLSQLQLMALICVYVRKANYFQQVFKRFEISHHHTPTPNIGFSKALSGFLMMMTQNGKLLYISDNAAEYLGHSMEDLLIHGDSVYDIIDKQDHQGVQTELCRTPTDAEDRMFLCRMNVSRNARRQMRFGDQKVVLVKGHFLSFLPLCSRNEPVFLAACAPLAMPETRECVVQGATNVFTTIHSMDMKIMHIDKNGEWHLGWDKTDLQGVSWYQLLHWESMREAQSKHRLITQSEQERSCIMLVRLQRKEGDWIYLHCVLQVKDNMENTQQPVIIGTNQVLSDREAAIMRLNPWLYHYYSAQSKLQYGMGYDPARGFGQPSPAEPSPTSNIPNAPPLGPAPFLNGNRTALGPPPPPPHLLHMAFPYDRMEAGPVDYSLHTMDGRYHQLPVDDAKPLHHHPKRKARSPNVSKIQQLAHNSPCPSPAIVDTGGGTLMSLTHSSSTSSRRILAKIGNGDPTEFIDQWNPSPPWSETALQKVPDLSHQELSPYVTTTPPTPSGTPSGVYSNQTHPTFSFDWSPEQYVPHSQYSVATGMMEEPQPPGAAPWPEHRLFPLQPPPPPRLVHPLQMVERRDGDTVPPADALVSRTTEESSASSS